jgi:hypothetical protein
VTWSALFGLTNIIALVGWLVLILLPRRPFTLSAVLYLGAGLLALAYTAMFVALFGGLVDPVRVAGASAPDLTDYSIGGLRALFMSDGGIVFGWTHYLALDLFTGLVIAREADARGWGRVAQAPVLLATFIAGPIGLLLWLLLRNRFGRRPARP